MVVTFTILNGFSKCLIFLAHPHTLMSNKNYSNNQKWINDDFVSSSALPSVVPWESVYFVPTSPQYSAQSPVKTGLSSALGLFKPSRIFPNPAPDVPATKSVFSNPFPGVYTLPPVEYRFAAISPALSASACRFAEPPPLLRPTRPPILDGSNGLNDAIFAFCSAACP